MAIDLLKERPDAHDRRFQREWFTCVCDVYPLLGTNPNTPDTPDTAYDVESEPVFGTPVRRVGCYIDNSPRRLASTTQELIIVDFTVYFRPSVDARIGFVLKNGATRSGRPMFTEVRIIAEGDVLHPKRGNLLVRVYCQAH